MVAQREGRHGRRRLWWVAAGVAVVLGLAGLASYRLVSMAGAMREAERHVQRASDALSEGDLEGATRSLERAQTKVFEANRALRSAPELTLVGFLPVVRQNLDGLEATVELTATVVHGGIRILTEAHPFRSDEGTLEVSLSAGTLPLSAVTAVQREIDELLLRLAPISRRELSSLVAGPIVDVHEELRTDARARIDQLRNLGAGLDLLAHLAGRDGPQRYLIAVANTAEMRGSGGMILNYGVLEGAEGRIDLVAFGRVDELGPPLPVPDRVVPPDYLARWAGFDPLARWRQANLAADFTLIAPVLQELYEGATGLEVDGVLQVDPQGLAALLDGVGPVVVPEVGEVRGDNVVSLVLNEAYFRHPGVEERSDVLGDVAEAAFTRLVDGEVQSLRTLATRLAEATTGRHLIMASSSPATQRVVERFGADGALPGLDEPPSVALTVQNLSGNKLDYYLDSELSLVGAIRPGSLGHLDATVTLRNHAPPGATVPKYVFGPGPGATATPAGVERALVTLYLPHGTQLEEVTGDATVEPATAGTEGGRPYAALIVDVPAGEERSVTLQLRLPPTPAAGGLITVPAPRVRPTTLHVDIDTGRGQTQGSVVMDRTWRFSAGTKPEEVLPEAFQRGS